MSRNHCCGEDLTSVVTLKRIVLEDDEQHNYFCCFNFNEEPIRCTYLRVQFLLKFMVSKNCTQTIDGIAAVPQQ